MSVSMHLGRGQQCRRLRCTPKQPATRRLQYHLLDISKIWSRFGQLIAGESPVVGRSILRPGQRCTHARQSHSLGCDSCDCSALGVVGVVLAVGSFLVPTASSQPLCNPPNSVGTVVWPGCARARGSARQPSAAVLQAADCHPLGHSHNAGFREQDVRMGLQHDGQLLAPLHSSPTDCGLADSGPRALVPNPSRPCRLTPAATPHSSHCECRKGSPLQFAAFGRPSTVRPAASRATGVRATTWRGLVR